jgi:hypothetical protein
LIFGHSSQVQLLRFLVSELIQFVMSAAIFKTISDLRQAIHTIVSALRPSERQGF